MSTAPALEVTNRRLTEQLDQLFREHSAFVYRTAFAVTGNADDAEDVLQTIFLRLTRRDSWPPNLKNNPKAYLYRAAVNQSLNTIERRRHSVLTDDAGAFEESGHSAGSRAAEAIRERLLTALEEMARTNPASVELLILRYVHNYSDREIAAMLGKSRTVIAVRLFRARAQLKKLIGAPQEKKS